MTLTLAQQTLKDARANLGVSEDPIGNNSGEAVMTYLASCGIDYPAPWCAAFIRYRIVHAAAELKVETKWISGQAAASSTHIWAWAKAHGYLLDKPVDGCVGLLRSDPDVNEFHHTFLVESVEGDAVHTIEGNSGPGGSSEGYEVIAHHRPISPHLVFVKIV